MIEVENYAELEKMSKKWKKQKKTQEKGFTLIPLRLYINEKSLAKIELALAKGKREYEKREKVKEREAHREMESAKLVH